MRDDFDNTPWIDDYIKTHKLQRRKRRMSNTAPTTARSDADFGFSMFSEDEMNALQPAVEVDTTDKQRVETMKALIMTLMNNLLQNPEKEWLKWPNRVEQAQAFIIKLNSI